MHSSIIYNTLNIMRFTNHWIGSQICCLDLNHLISCLWTLLFGSCL